MLRPNISATPRVQHSVSNMGDRKSRMSTPGIATIIAPGPTISTPEPCEWLKSYSITGVCLFTAYTIIIPTPVSFPPPTTISALPALSTSSTSAYGAVSTTKSLLPSPTNLTGQVNVEWPSAGCDGFKVNKTCVPWQYWLNMYNEAFPPPGSPKPQPSIVFQTPDLDIHGPSNWCNGFTINNFCLRMADVLAMLGDRLTKTSTSLATGTAVSFHVISSFHIRALSVLTVLQSPPAPGSTRMTHSLKLGVIAIPIIVLLFAALGGYCFWRRRAIKKASFASALPPPLDPNPIAQVARLYGPPSPIVERDPRPSIYEERQQGGRYLRNGVKIFDARHAKRERERDIARRSAEAAPVPVSAPRKEWWDKDLLF